MMGNLAPFCQRRPSAAAANSIRKTAGNAEREAWGWLMERVAARYARHAV
jgi:hypothetical protein